MLNHDQLETLLREHHDAVYEWARWQSGQGPLGPLVTRADKAKQAIHDAFATHGVAGTAPTSAPPEESYPDQTVLHAEGQCGNCLQATIAGVLGWPLAAVPHFALLGEDHWWDCAQAWLSAQGYWIDYQPTSYAAEGGELLPKCWLSGRSPRGFSHAVIGDAATGQVLHDPHPSRAGLIEVGYTIYFFRKPARGVTAVAHEVQGPKP